jgi:hypothetical protein
MGLLAGVPDDLPDPGSVYYYNRIPWIVKVSWKMAPPYRELIFVLSLGGCH